MCLLAALPPRFTYEAILAYRTEAALRKVQENVKAETDRINRDIAANRQADVEARDAAARDADQLRSARALVQRLETERQQRKEAAWSNFFQPSTGCKAEPGTTACANEHMVARKRFDSQYLDR